MALLQLKRGILIVYQGVWLDDMKVHLKGMKDNKNYSWESSIFAQWNTISFYLQTSDKQFGRFNEA